MSQAIVTQRPVISLQIPEGRWPVVGVQRNIVTVSLLCQVNNMRQWNTSYWSRPKLCNNNNSVWRYFGSIRLFDLGHVKGFELLTLPLLHTMMELKQTDCFKLVHAAPLLFLTKEPKLRGGFFDHFGVFILVSGIDQWESEVWGQAMGAS